MDSISISEEPLFRKCCYVLPLRFCLQTWAFIKLAANLLAIAYVTVGILFCLAFGRGDTNGLTILIFLLVALLVDVGFLLTLIVGIFQKSIALIRVFYFYEFFAMAVETSCIIFIVVKMALEEINAEGIIVILMGIAYILLDLCIILTLKSEIVKLRNKNQYDFSRMSLEREQMGKLNSENTIIDNSK